MSCDRVGVAEDLDDDDPHIAACPDCSARRGAYRRLAAAIAGGASAQRLPPGWKEWTLARARAAGSSHRRALVVGAAALIAAAAGVLLFVRRGEERPLLSLSIDRTGNKWRGTAGPGDEVRVVASASQAPGSELRIYRRSELVFRCPGAPAPTCERSGDEVVARWRIPAAGEYQVVWVVSRGPLPGPTGSLAGDLRVATAVGARLAASEPVHVF